MTIIKVEPNKNGGHENQTIFNATLKDFSVPIGYAVVPENVDVQENFKNFPFGEVKTDFINGVQTVIGWTPLPIPEPKPTHDLPDERTLLKAQVQAQADREEFLEDCIAEMAMELYG